MRCTTDTPHCENCGSTNPEDITNLADTDGYSRCCNELVADDARTCRGLHMRSTITP